MVIGIGTDVLSPARIAEETLEKGDPFFERAFSPYERAQAALRSDRHHYLIARFCAKEAVYKAVSGCGEELRPGDIEILDDSDGRPHVTLRGRTFDAVRARWGEVEILVSISHEDDVVSAFALAQTR